MFSEIKTKINLFNKNYIRMFLEIKTKINLFN